LFQLIAVPELTKALIASFVGVSTLIGIMTRPFRWNEAIIAMAGATLLLVLGLISPADAFSTLYLDWNTFLFFLGMMVCPRWLRQAGRWDTSCGLRVTGCG
jgi:arsenical pump membrane protein